MSGCQPAVTVRGEMRQGGRCILLGLLVLNCSKWMRQFNESALHLDVSVLYAMLVSVRFCLRSSSTCVEYVVIRRCWPAWPACIRLSTASATATSTKSRNNCATGTVARMRRSVVFILSNVLPIAELLRGIPDYLWVLWNKHVHVGRRPWHLKLEL